MTWAQPTLEHFRAWAYDPDAGYTHGPLDDPDADLLLRDWRYVPALIDAAADSHCPNGESCVRILTDYAMDLVRRHQYDQFGRLRAAAGHARGRHRVDEWATHVGRMLGYAERRGHVNPATAEQMAIDLLIRPAWYATWDEQTRARRLTVQIADPATPSRPSACREGSHDSRVHRHRPPHRPDPRVWQSTQHTPRVEYGRIVQQGDATTITAWAAVTAAKSAPTPHPGRQP